MNEPCHSYELYIRTTPAALWEALTSSELTPRYFMGLSVQSDWNPGTPVRQVRKDGVLWNEGIVLDVVPPTKLVTTFQTTSPEGADDPPSRLAWLLEPLGEVTKLTLVHDRFGAETATYRMVDSGWPVVLSALKTLLESGRTLPVPASSPFENV